MLEIKRVENNQNNLWSKFKNTFFNSYNYPSRRKFYDSSYCLFGLQPNGSFVLNW